MYEGLGFQIWGVREKDLGLRVKGSGVQRVRVRCGMRGP